MTTTASITINGTSWQESHDDSTDLAQAGSGTGGLAGLRGEGSYVADAMEYTLTLSYDLD